MTNLGEPLLRFEEIDSTNNYARELAARGAAEGTAIIARQQTAGRGRQGRAWMSPPGAGLYVSIILRPRVAPAAATFITLAAAVAVAETLTHDYHLPADIKYPNDIHINGRKICGILVESATEGEHLLYAVLGIGVNLAQREFPEELQETATSLLIESGNAIEPEEFLRPLLARLNTWYPASLKDPARVLERWEALSSYAHACAIRVIANDSTIEGVTRGLTASGALRVELDGGEIREIVSGEISIRKA